MSPSFLRLHCLIYPTAILSSPSQSTLDPEEGFVPCRTGRERDTLLLWLVIHGEDRASLSCARFASWYLTTRQAIQSLSAHLAQTANSIILSASTPCRLHQLSWSLPQRCAGCSGGDPTALPEQCRSVVVSTGTQRRISPEWLSRPCIPRTCAAAHGPRIRQTPAAGKAGPRVCSPPAC